MNNMRIWNKVKRPPESALKKITGGRLSGMTDIKPQWRYEAMTELFGPIGIGWKFKIIGMWTDDGSEGQKSANAQIELFIKDDGEWSEAIPGVGGSMFIANEKNGPHTSDEAYKMAVTDALGTAMKMLGVAADIYAGQFDGTKYKTPATTIDGPLTAKEKEALPRAIQYYKDLIDSPDDSGDILAEAKEKWNALSQTMQNAIQDGMGPEKAPSSNRMYRTLLKEYTK